MSYSQSTVDVRRGLIELKYSKGKGVGSFATIAISRGERILEEVPFFSVLHGSKPIDVYNKFLDLGNDHPQENQDQSKLGYLSMHFNEKKRDYYYKELKEGAMKDVALRSSARKFKEHDRLMEAAKVLAIFDGNQVPGQRRPDHDDITLNIARINHSCTPNVKVAWNSTIGAYTVQAILHIEEGEELFCSYVNPMDSHEGRKRAIVELGLDFECQCKACDFGPLISAGLAYDIEKARREVCTLYSLVGRGKMGEEQLYKQVIECLDRDCMIEMIEFKVNAYDDLAVERLKDHSSGGGLASRPEEAAKALKQAKWWAEICLGPDGTRTKELQRKLRDWRVKSGSLSKMPSTDEPFPVRGSAREDDDSEV